MIQETLNQPKVLPTSDSVNPSTFRETSKSGVKDNFIRVLLSKSKHRSSQHVEEQALIQRLQNISEEMNVLSIQQTESPQTGLIQSTLALNISSQTQVVQKFQGLADAVQEYNTTASKEKWDLVQKNGATLEEIRKLAELRATAFTSQSKPPGFNSKFKNAMGQFCETTMHYAEIMDTLAQHHPEWVGLAWGTMKLFVLIPIEYQKIQESVTTNLARIGSKLQLMGLLLRFFPSEKTVDAATAIYASIAEFLEVSLRWLQSSWLGRF